MIKTVNLIAIKSESILKSKEITKCITVTTLSNLFRWYFAATVVDFGR